MNAVVKLDRRQRVLLQCPDCALEFRRALVAAGIDRATVELMVDSGPREGVFLCAECAHALQNLLACALAEAWDLRGIVPMECVG